jgi:Rhodanese-related sulfurtransferase
VFSRRPKKWATREEVEEIDLAIRDAVEEVVQSIKILRKRELDEYVKSSTPPQDLEIEELPPDAVAVDLRDGESYRRRHLPGAVRADPEDVLSLVDRMGRDKTYVFYCYGGGLSLNVAESLRNSA